MVLNNILVDIYAVVKSWGHYLVGKVILYYLDAGFPSSTVTCSNTFLIFFPGDFVQDCAVKKFLLEKDLPLSGPIPDVTADVYCGLI